MKRLPPDKRNKLIMVVVGTVALIGLVYFLLIGPQQEQNRRLTNETQSEQDRLALIKKTILQANANAQKADDITQLLANTEKDEVDGDVIVWTYETIRQFKASHHVEINTIGQPVQSEEEMLPGFPYKQIKFLIVGTGFYHDIGKFIADLENQFPHIRVLNLSIDSVAVQDTTPEKLTFRMEVAALLKPNS
jgi:Tfp pilus assembly protein PilO